MARRELKQGDRFTINIDPLSHGGNMTYPRVDLEVVDRPSIGLDISIGMNPGAEDNPSCGEYDVEFLSSTASDLLLDIAVCKVLHWVELDEDEKQVTEDDPEHVGTFVTLVSVKGGDWHHTFWVMSVDFVEEN